MPNLQTAWGTASTVLEKTQALYKQFYPKSQANLKDIIDTTFADGTAEGSLELDPRATLEEVQKPIRRQKAGKALGIDGIATGFLKAIGKLLVLAITDLLTDSWKTRYYPEVF